MHLAERAQKVVPRLSRPPVRVACAGPAMRGATAAARRGARRVLEDQRAGELMRRQGCMCVTSPVVNRLSKRRSQSVERGAENAVWSAQQQVWPNALDRLQVDGIEVGWEFACRWSCLWHLQRIGHARRAARVVLAAAVLCPVRQQCGVIAGGAGCMAHPPSTPR